MATNTVPCGAYRGFGAPQGLFAMERHLDRIARELGLDPLDVRLKNIVRPGDSFPCGQLLTDGIHAEEVLLKAAEISDYRRKRAEYAKDAGRIRRGIGLTVAMHGGGFTGSGEADMGTRVRLEYRGGEGFLVHASSAEMGQGSATVLPMVAAEALGIPAARVKAPAPDTAITPNSGPTVASRTTMYVGRVVKETCNNLIAHLRDFLARAEGCPVEEILFSEGRFTRGSRGWSTEEAARACLDAEGILDAWGTLPAGCAGNWDPEAFRGEAYKGYAWIAQAVEVEVDLDTYEVEAKRAVLAAEIGRAIHPVMVEGQLAGGFLQGLGWSHIEDLTVTPEGRYSAEHLNAYLIPTTLDTPEWDITVLEHPCEVGPYGAKGIGELPMDGVTPAFVSAVENATGAVGTEVPLTGEKLFRLLEGK
jgi:CO/xanthine dehydrogenase Mo-binding subunit